jgi:purine nucleosidase
VTIIAIGPLTNLAHAYLQDKTIVGKMKNLVLLGGAYLGRGNTLALSSEFNFYFDPKAAEIVIKNFPNTTILPIEVMQELMKMSSDLVYKAFSSESKRGKLLT